MSDRVLVTGSAGFVGRHLVQTLARDRDDEIVATDIVETPPARFEQYLGNRVEYTSGDVTNEAFLDEILDDEFDRIYHLAAVVGVEDYVKNPLHIADVNVIATRNVLDRVRDRDVRFVFTSTSEIYGRNRNVPWHEESDRVLGPPTVDRWSYSTGKSVCEHMIHGLADADGPFTATVLRPFNLYGPGQRPKFALPAFVDRVVNDEPPVIYDDGCQTRCFTYIDDFVEGVIRASVSEGGENEVFNLGATREIEIRDLAELVLEVADKPDLEAEHIDTDDLYGDSYEDLRRRVPDVTKADERLGWTAETPLKEGIKQVLKWGREQYR